MATGASVPTFRRIASGASMRIPVRNREFLAGSEHESFPDSVPDVGDMIPALAVGRADGPGAALAAAVRGVIDEALPAYGGVLLRGLPLAGKAGFERLIAELGYEPIGYQGGIAVRRNDSGTALNASAEDPRITLSPHNEMAYLPRYPRKVFFFCERAAAVGGEVPINDIRETAKILPTDLQDTFRARGIRYHRNLRRDSAEGEMGWVDTFGTADTGAVEDHLAASGYAYEWSGDGRLHYHYTRDAYVPNPETGEQLWFNQVTELHCSYWRSHPDFPPDLADHDYPATTSYGDGAPIELDRISYLRGALWRTTRAVRMTDGDLLVLDNQVLQHGRFAYQGPRRHYVSLTR